MRISSPEGDGVLRSTISSLSGFQRCCRAFHFFFSRFRAMATSQVYEERLDPSLPVIDFSTPELERTMPVLETPLTVTVTASSSASPMSLRPLPRPLLHRPLQRSRAQLLWSSTAITGSPARRAMSS